MIESIIKPSGFGAGFWQALSYFAAFGWMWIVFRFARHSVDEHASKLKVFGVVLATSAAFAFFSWSSLGTHVEDADPVMGGGDVVTDYKANAERNKDATIMFLLTFVPGVAALAKEDKRKSSD